TAGRPGGQDPQGAGGGRVATDGVHGLLRHNRGDRAPCDDLVRAARRSGREASEGPAVSEQAVSSGRLEVIPQWLRPVARTANEIDAQALSPRTPTPPRGARPSAVLML